jgi:hypothetical protein
LTLRRHYIIAPLRHYHYAIDTPLLIATLTLFSFEIFHYFQRLFRHAAAIELMIFAITPP